MAILSLSLHRTPRAVPPPAAVDLRACRFERTVLRSALQEGGVLTCVQADGRERQLQVAMTWDVLAQLRGELARVGAPQPDDTIIRCVLRYWGSQELMRRLRSGVLLPAEGMVLASLGGPAGNEARRLLVACGLLPLLAA